MEIKIGTLNTRTLRTEEKMQELENALDDITWDIIGLAEIRRNTETLMERKNGYVLLHSSAVKSMFGTGFIIKNKFRNNIVDFIPKSKRIAVLKMKFKKTNCTIIQLHAPTTEHKKEEIEEFYEEIGELIRKEHSKEKDPLLIIGDFNACVGSRKRGEESIMGSSSKGKRNDSGILMSNFVAAQGLKIMNSYYDHEDRWTWVAPNKKKYEIDYVLTKSQKNIQNFQIEKDFKFDSDHRLIVVTFVPNTKEIHHEDKITQYKIKSSVETYKKHLKKLMSEISTTQGSIQDVYNKIEDCIKSSVKQENEEAKKTRRKISSKITDETKKLIEKREKLNKIVNKTIAEKIEHCEIRKLTKKKIREDINRYEDDIINRIMITTGSTKRIKQELSNTKNTWINKLRKEDGTTTTNREEIVEVATRYYEKLYSSEEDIEEAEIPDQQHLEIQEFKEKYSILQDEVTKAIDELKTEKAPGHDGITNDLLIHGKEVICPKLQELFNRILYEVEIPNQWTISKIILLYKKGLKEDISNYRPISLSATLYKVFAKIIQKRMRKKINENQPQEQAGFRSAYSTIDNLQTMNQLLEKSREYHVDFSYAVIDYTKAFDSIHQKSIWEGLKSIQMDEIYINVLKKLYKSQAYISLDKEGRTFQLKRGTKQGCPLSAELFNTVLELIFRQINWEQYGIPINGENITNLRFADDVILIGKNTNELRNMVKELKDESKKHGLSINMSKTKFLARTEETEIEIDGEIINKTNDCIYLGQIISCENVMDKEIERRIKIGWKKYWSMRKIFKSMKLNEKTKTKALKMCIYPAILYGCQTWSLTKKQLKRLDVTQYQMFRSILGIRKYEKISNQRINEVMQMKDLSKEATKMKWNWAGHVVRMDNNRWAKKLTEWIPKSNKRTRGRKRIRWYDEMRKNVGTEWQSIARDRQLWKKVVREMSK